MTDGKTEKDIRDDWYAFVWAHLGERVAVTFERAGVEHETVGPVICDSDGSYRIGGTRFVAGSEGFPVRWATCAQAYDWSEDPGATA